MTQRIQRERGGRRKCGFTLVELLTAAMVSALVATAGATLIFAVGNASKQTRDLRETKVSGHYALRRIAETIRSARGIGEVTSTAVTLWVADRNSDDLLNVNELGIIEYDAATKQITYLDTSASTSLATIDATKFAKKDDFKIVLNAVPEVVTITWAEGVESFALIGYPATTETRIVDALFTIGTGGDAASFQTSAGPHASGDYLYDASANAVPLTGSTRPRRIKISKFNGLKNTNVFPVAAE